METKTDPSLSLAPVRPRVRVAPAETAGEEHGQRVVPARPLRLVQQRLARVESAGQVRGVSRDDSRRCRVKEGEARRE